MTNYNDIINELMKVQPMSTPPAIKAYWESKAHKIVYTGQILRYFDYMYGDLEYRSLDFKNYEVMTDFQGCSQMNYPDENTSWNRIIQHKHFTKSKSKYDLITCCAMRSLTVGIPNFLLPPLALGISTSITDFGK